MTAPLVEIDDLQVMRGRKSVLRIDHLDILRGEVLAVVGPNGAGKSSLLLTLARLIRPNQASILFAGQPIEQASDLSIRRRIALVLQDPLLFDMSVFDNVAMGLRFRGMSKNAIKPAVDQWLDKLGIADLHERRATELSGGEAQRVCIARALVLEPELLLLDEPFSALDPPTRRRLSADFSALLAETKTTTVLVTHNIADAQQIAHRIAVILSGSLRKVGSVDEILNSAEDSEIKEFVQQ